MTEAYLLLDYSVARPNTFTDQKTVQEHRSSPAHRSHIPSPLRHGLPIRAQPTERSIFQALQARKRPRRSTKSPSKISGTKQTTDLQHGIPRLATASNVPPPRHHAPGPKPPVSVQTLPRTRRRTDCSPRTRTPHQARRARLQGGEHRHKHQEH